MTRKMWFALVVMVLFGGIATAQDAKSRSERGGAVIFFSDARFTKFDNQLVSPPPPSQSGLRRRRSNLEPAERCRMTRKSVPAHSAQQFRVERSTTCPQHCG